MVYLKWGKLLLYFSLKDKVGFMETKVYFSVVFGYLLVLFE